MLNQALTFLEYCLSCGLDAGVFGIVCFFVCFVGVIVLSMLFPIFGMFFGWSARSCAEFGCHLSCWTFGMASCFSIAFCVVVCVFGGMLWVPLKVLTVLFG